MDFSRTLFCLTSWLLCHVDALTRLLCQQSGPMTCRNGGGLYIDSVKCSSYGHAMQLLQENCYGRRTCQGDVTTQLMERCCSRQYENPRVLYHCSGSSEATDDHSTNEDFQTFQSVSDARHSLEGQIIVVAVVAGIVLLWGVGLVFYYLRYKSKRCIWLSGKRKKKPLGSAADNPTYACSVIADEGHYAQILTPSAPVYSNIHTPCVPPQVY